MKKKKLKFTVDMIIEELSRVSLLNGVFFCKTRLISGGHGDFNELTSREHIESNCVKWKRGNFTFDCKLSASPTTQILETCLCRISVRKEVRGGRSYDKVGYVDVNLAEYAGAGKVTRQYILEGYHDGKKSRLDNCILKISANMTLTSGDPLFKPQERPADFLMTSMGEASKLSNSESFINTSASQDAFQVRHVCSDSLELPLSSESPTHYQHKRNISNGSTVCKNVIEDIRNAGSQQILSHSRQSSGTTADSSADLDAAIQSPLQRGKRSSHRQLIETRQNANDVVGQLLNEDLMDLDTCNTDKGIELTMFLEDGVSTMSKIETRRFRERGNTSFVDLADRFKTL